MERRIPPERREILPGVTLKASVMGGYSVERDGDYIGWIHAGPEDSWSAYVRRPGTSGDLLGRYAQAKAVKVIVTAWDAGSIPPNGCRS